MQVFIIVLVAIAALVAVIYPFISSRGDEGRGREFLGDDPAAIDAAVTRYREAVRAGTLCLECGFANPADAVFCADCGEPLIAAEFEPAAGESAVHGSAEGGPAEGEPAEGAGAGTAGVAP